MFRKHQHEGGPVELGLRPNWRQFTLLVLINAFVGGLVGLERTVVPLIAGHDFGLVSKAVVLSFLVSFGVVKALANVMAGRWSDRFGRHTLSRRLPLVNKDFAVVVVSRRPYHDQGRKTFL